MGLFNPYHAWRKAPEFARADHMPGFIAVGVRGRKGQDVHATDPQGGAIREDVDADWGRIEALGQAPNPPSLYRCQLQQRLGHLPDHLDPSLAD